MLAVSDFEIRIGIGWNCNRDHVINVYKSTSIARTGHISFLGALNLSHSNTTAMTSQRSETIWSEGERSPLLGNHTLPQYNAEPADNDDASLKSQEAAESKYRYFWWALSYVLVAGLLTIFIVGWIDADDVDFDFAGALKRALGGGLSGAAAMVLQVLLLMPIRTIMNYQYRHGKGFRDATKTLYGEGGPRRYYQGLGAALIQGPVARFGDTAANAGILALLHSNSYLAKLPSPIQTI